MGRLEEVAAGYAKLLDESRGIVEVEVVSADELKPEQEKRLSAALETLTGQRVRLTKRQDSSLLGGVTVRIGDTLYDGSVLSRLQQVRRELAAE
jgi:F-type H+-transporting ATPase subunit delta